MTNNSERGWWGVGYVYAQFIDRPGLALQALAPVARPKVEFVSCMCPVWNLSWRPTDGSTGRYNLGIEILPGKIERKGPAIRCMTQCKRYHGRQTGIPSGDHGDLSGIIFASLLTWMTAGG